MELKRKSKTRMIVLVASLLVLTTSLSYAFFAGGAGPAANTDVNVASGQTTKLTFTEGTAINLELNETTLAEGGGNVSGSTTSSATLTLGTNVANATDNYNIYFDIAANTFVYTTAAKTPEILLSITDPDGAAVTLSGLTAVSPGIYDITEYKGLIKVSEDYEISGNTTTTQEWEAEITFVNLTTNQALNEGKTLDAEFILQNEKIELTGAETLIASHNDTNGLFYHDSNLENGANDNSYRYSGSNAVVANNYVCFGSDVSPCPADNIYRIIGYFDNGNGYEMKLIRNTFIANMAWDSGDVNDWVNSSLNTYLNNDFYNTIPASYQSMIMETTWNLGSTSDYRMTAKEHLTAEKSNTSYNNLYATTTVENIGLMYPSDYGYAAYSIAWTTDLYDYKTYNIPANNWMFLGSNCWTISHRASTSSSSWYVNYSGYAINNEVGFGYVVLPVMYLSSSTKILGGTGSSADPFIVG